MRIRYLGFAILVLATSILLLGINASPVEKKGCSYRTRAAILLQCAEFIQILGPEIPPSEQCCAVMKAADIPCLCHHIPKNVEKIISMKKFVDAAHTCGSEIPPPGGMCGSYTIPPSSPGEPPVQHSPPPPESESPPSPEEPSPPEEPPVQHSPPPPVSESPPSPVKHSPPEAPIIHHSPPPPVHNSPPKSPVRPPRRRSPPKSPGRPPRRRSPPKSPGRPPRRRSPPKSPGRRRPPFFRHSPHIP